MYKCEREDEVLSVLNEIGYATVEYLSEKMNISPSSIRRDLKNLEERGLVNRSYGGVRLSDSTGKRVPFSLRSHENSLQKKQIAKEAVGLVHSGDVVILDGSSTACFIAELLPSVGGVTVITNSIDVMGILKNFDIKAFCTGGLISSENRPVLVGGYAEEFLSKVHADLFFFSVQGVDGNGNCYDCYADEVSARNVMLKCAKQKVLLCDNSKFGKPSTFLQCNVGDLDCVICDAPENGFFKGARPRRILVAGEGQKKK